MDYLVDGETYGLSYKELKNLYDEYIIKSDDDFMEYLTPALHLACIICYLKEIPTIRCLSDRGIIHQLVHLMDEPEPMIELSEVRKLFEQELKLA